MKIGQFTAVIVLGLGTAVLHGQSSAMDASGPAFATATVNASAEAANRGGVLLQPGGRLAAKNVTLKRLIESAYQRHGFDRVIVQGGPDWIDSAGFDVTAEAGGEHALDPDGFPRRTWLMLRTLLADRFKLRARTETRELPIYALVTAQGAGEPGAGLRKSAADCAAVLAMWNKGEKPPVEPGKGPPCSVGQDPGRLVVNALTMSQVASILSGIVGRTVIDRTGLDGNYEFELEAVEVRGKGPLGPHARPSDTTESIFTALPKHLGLRLESTTGPVEVLIVDRVEKP